MCETVKYHHFINHLKQRLVIILDHNIPNGIDPCQSDIHLLRELYTLYDEGSIDTYTEVEVRVQAEQVSLFEQTLTPEQRKRLV